MGQTTLGRSSLRASTLGRHHSRLIVPLGRSSLRASTLGRHNNRTNSLGTKLSQRNNTWGDRIKKLKFKEIIFLKILSRSNSCGTKLSVSLSMYTWETPQQDKIRLGCSSLRASKLGRRKNRSNSLGTIVSYSIKDLRERTTRLIPFQSIRHTDRIEIICRAP